MIIKGRLAQKLLRVLPLAVVICLLIGGPAALAEPANLPAIVVENGTVMLPVIHGNEQAVSGLLQYLQGLPEFSGMTICAVIPH